MSVYAIVTKSGRVQEAPVALRSKYNGKVGFHLLTDEERKQYGWYPCTIINESYNPVYQFRSDPVMVFENEHVTVTYTLTDKSPEQVYAELLEAQRNTHKEIDSAVDQIVFNTAGNRTEEYKMALEQAQQWKDSNYEGPAPIAVLADVVPGIRDEIQACERILQTAQLWTDRLMKLRHLRLQTKAKINNTASQEEIYSIMRDFRDEVYSI